MVAGSDQRPPVALNAQDWPALRTQRQQDREVTETIADQIPRAKVFYRTLA
jgi:predicted nucleotidyltransferase